MTLVVSEPLFEKIPERIYRLGSSDCSLLPPNNVVHHNVGGGGGGCSVLGAGWKRVGMTVAVP